MCSPYLNNNKNLKNKKQKYSDILRIYVQYLRRTYYDFPYNLMHIYIQGIVT